jgi:hypothetical protein
VKPLAPIAALAAHSSARDQSWIVADLAAQIGPTAKAHTRVTGACAEREPELSACVAAFMAAAGPQATGPALESKLRVVRFGPAGAGEFRVQLAPTTWERGRAFQMALLSHEQPPRDARGWLEAAFEGEPMTPGLAAVHATVVTRDGKLALVQRAAHALYRPLHWAATFEEQMVSSDLEHADVLAAAVRRGLHEELGVRAEDARVSFALPLYELETFNVAFLSFVDVALDARELEIAASKAPDAADAARMAFVDATPGRLRELAQSTGAPDCSPLHPTSALRLEALARHLAGVRP